MSDQKQPFSGDEAVQKAKDYAQDNPDSARSAIDKVEDFIDARTGGTFSGAVDKGGDFIESQLGLPNDAGGTEPAPTDPTTPGVPPSTPPAQPAPAPAPVPAPVPAPEEPSSPPADPAAVPTTPPAPTEPTPPVDAPHPTDVQAPEDEGGTIDLGQEESAPSQDPTRP